MGLQLPPPSDVRGFCNLYCQDHQLLSGRAIARLFQGIASPCFSSTTWGRMEKPSCRRLQLTKMNDDF